MPPFTADAAQSIAALGECGLIEHIRKWLGDVTAPSPRGIGDDCAVLPARPLPGARLVTTDSVLWGRHFDDSVTPRAAGAKLIKRNLSDIAAMGGTPADAVLSLIIGPDVAVGWMAEFFDGVAESCRAWGVELAGGDIAAAPEGFFCATLSLTGFAEKPLLRQGAFVGDALLVTGELGGSLAGKHYAFTPRLAEGRWLAARPEVRAGMDISDGLAKDIPAMLPAGADALLDTASIPVSAAARQMSGDADEALCRALNDGEDYELLVAVESRLVAPLLAAWHEAFPGEALTRIGNIIPAQESPGGRLLDVKTGSPIDARLRGYRHFER
ncbi:MAG: thiamine-phosphate kinase [Puniceicoccales bacterium]|jgi:thiamine-monophosphate kinase|nr:thiamine-phosphate kinase [Puniceicoccales bacterium]